MDQTIVNLHDTNKLNRTSKMSTLGGMVN